MDEVRHFEFGTEIDWQITLSQF